MTKRQISAKILLQICVTTIDKKVNIIVIVKSLYKNLFLILTNKKKSNFSKSAQKPNEIQHKKANEKNREIASVVLSLFLPILKEPINKRSDNLKSRRYGKDRVAILFTTFIIASRIHPSTSMALLKIILIIISCLLLVVLLIVK